MALTRAVTVIFATLQGVITTDLSMKSLRGEAVLSLCLWEEGDARNGAGCTGPSVEDRRKEFY